MTKRCSKCGTTKPRAAFYRRRAASEGLASWCRECTRNYRAHLSPEKKEIILAQARQYKKGWHKRQRELAVPYWTHRRRTNPQLHLAELLRGRLYAALHRTVASHATAVRRIKVGSAVLDCGCTMAELLVHLERQFAPGMSWDNWGQWHVDHRIPLSSVDLSDREQLLKVCHYSNLQPLWAADNLRKGATYLPQQIKAEERCSDVLVVAI